MKVTIVTSMPPIKGISLYSTNLIDELSNIVEIDVLGFNNMYPDKMYPGGAKDNKSLGYKNRKIKILNVLNWYNPFGWIYHAFKIKGDIVHAQWWSFVLAPVYSTILFIVKFIRKKKVVITVHNVTTHEKSFIKNYLNSVVLFFGDYFIVHNDSNKETLVNLHGIRPEDVTVIPHGVLKPPIKPIGMKKVDSRADLGIHERDIVLLFFGIIRDYKGVDILLEAFNELINENKKYSLIIAGKPWEDWGKYASIISTEAFGKVKTDLRYIPDQDIEKYFSASDLAVFPYKHFDSQTGAGNLALYYKLPMVVSNVGGLPDLVKDEKLIFKAGDTRDLVQTIKYATEQNTLAKITNDSKELRDDLSWVTIASITAQLYINAKK